MKWRWTFYCWAWLKSIPESNISVSKVSGGGKIHSRAKKDWQMSDLWPTGGPTVRLGHLAPTKNWFTIAIFV